MQTKISIYLNHVYLGINKTSRKKKTFFLESQENDKANNWLPERNLNFFWHRIVTDKEKGLTTKTLKVVL